MAVLAGISSDRSSQLQSPDSHNVWQLLFLVLHQTVVKGSRSTVLRRFWCQLRNKFHESTKIKMSGKKTDDYPAGPEIQQPVPE